MEELNKTATIKVLCRYLSENYGDNYTYEGFNHNRIIETHLGPMQDNNTIEIYAFSKKSEDKYLMIEIGIQNDFRQIYIPKIFTPALLQHNGVGKKLIRLIFEIGLLYGYHVFVVQLTDSFRARLLSRGAVETDQFDTLQIVRSTRLN